MASKRKYGRPVRGFTGGYRGRTISSFYFDQAVAVYERLRKRSYRTTERAADICEAVAGGAPDADPQLLEDTLTDFYGIGRANPDLGIYEPTWHTAYLAGVVDALSEFMDDSALPLV